MKTIIFDFDGTLTKKSNEVWRKIWEKVNALDVDDMLYERFSKGELTYTDWCNEIEKEYIKRGLTSHMIDEIIEKFEMMDNLEETLKALKDEGYDLRILSGGIDYVIYSLLKDNKKYFSDIRCGKFFFDGNGKFIKMEDTDSDEEGKARYILNHIKATNSKPEEIIFIGNGHNDRFVSQSGCHTICLNPNGTNHKNKDVWHNYIENTQDLNDILEIIHKIENNKKAKR